MDAIWIILLVAIVLLGGIAIYRHSRGKRAIPGDVRRTADRFGDKARDVFDRNDRR